MDEDDKEYWFIVTVILFLIAVLVACFAGLCPN